MVPVKVGIVGLGVMGRLYGDALMCNPRARVAAVADLNPERLELARQAYGCPAYEGYEAMYRAGALDAVVIVLPDSLHRDAVVKAAETRLHILVEKPFATSVADADAMVQAIDKAGVKCMVEFFNRWSPPFAKARDALQGGDLGDLIAFNIELNDAVSVPAQMLAWSAQSSPAWFLMSHTADLASWITGKRPVAVHAQGVKKVLAQRGIDTYDLIEALAEYPDGTLGRFTNCWVLPNGMPLLYELKMRIVGSQAAVDIDTSDQELHLITQERLNHPVTAWGKVQGRYVGHPYAMLADFIDNVVEDTEPLVGPLAGWENTVFLEAVHQSLREGRTVKIHW